MGLNVYLKDIGVHSGEEFELYSDGITHNLNEMAEAAGIYEVLWRPEDEGIELASEIIPILEEGLEALIENPLYFEKFNPVNGWGTYDYLVRFCTNYLKACKLYPDSYVEVSR